MHSKPVTPILVPRIFKNYNGFISDLNNISNGSQPITLTLFRFNPTLPMLLLEISKNLRFLLRFGKIF